MLRQVARKEPYNQKVDVYSFGITLWEMLSGKLPFKGVDRDEFMATVVAKKFRPPVSKKLPVALVNLLQACWDESPLKRPSFASILATLETVMMEVTRADSILPTPSPRNKQKEGGNNDRPKSAKRDDDQHSNEYYTNQKLANWSKG